MFALFSSLGVYTFYITFFQGFCFFFSYSNCIPLRSTFIAKLDNFLPFQSPVIFLFVNNYQWFTSGFCNQFPFAENLGFVIT